MARRTSGARPAAEPAVGVHAPVVPLAEHHGAVLDELTRLRRAVDSSPDLLLLHDARGRLFFANRAARRLLGVRAGAPLPPAGPAELFDVSDRELERIGAALEHDGRWSGDVVVRGAHGRRIPAAAHLVAHVDAAGRVDCVSTVARDLSDRRRTEAALRAVVQASPVPLVVLDGHGIVHVWNRACERVFGWSAAEALGRSPRFVAGGASSFDALVARAFAGETVTRARTHCVRAGGDELVAEVAVAPMRDADGRIVTVVAALADVTAQERAEAILSDREQRFRSLAQHTSDMVLVVDGDGVVTYANASAAEFLGRDVEDVVGGAPPDLVDPSDAPAVTALFTRLRNAAGATERLTFRLAGTDGTTRWVEMTASNLLDDPAVRGIVTTTRDVTERFEAEAAIRASEERLRALVASASDAISVVDPAGTVRYASPVIDAMLGYPPGDAYGRNVLELAHPDDRGRLAGLLARSGEQRSGRPAEIRLLRADGSWMFAEIVANDLLDDPSVEGIVVTTRDVTERHEAEEALRASDARYRAVVDDQTELVCRYLPDTTLTFVNRAFADFYGRTRDELVGTRLLDLFVAIDRAAQQARLRTFGRGNEVQTREAWEIAARGALRWVQWTDRAFVDERGEVVEFQSVGRDATDRRRAMVLTSHQAEILEGIARGVPLEETLHRIATTVEDHFPQLTCTISLLDAGEPGPSPDAADAADDADATRWSVPVLASNGHTVLGTVEVHSREPGSPDREHEQIVSLLAHLASIAIERAAFEERLAHQSMHDPLTGLPNRVLFLDRLALAVARGRRMQTHLAVLFLDLDRFKLVNDSAGHDAGDELLVAVARRLEAVVRPGDTVARFGGDEFTVLCEDLPPDVARDRAVEVAERVLAAVGQPFVVRGVETFVRASVGIAISSGDDRPADLLRDADAAMYDAKESGRGRVAVFDDTMRVRALTRHATENALHRALERSELRVFFQPVVSLREGRCVGAEALVRWQHPERGLVNPGEFVPLAEETGLVVALGEWVLEQAAREAAQWQLEHDQPFLVSVNLSARQLAHPELAAAVAGVIARTGVQPSNLCLEITETVLMDDAETVLRVIEQLRALGVHLHIDDFGTGYSSLGYLKRFPIDGVKIDRSFVDGLGSDPGDGAIVSAVIGLAHALDLTVVAEGVESEGQLTELVSLGCDEAQGYFFAPPQPAADLRRLIGAGRSWRPPGHRVMTLPGRRFTRP